MLISIGILRCGLPPLPTLTFDLQEEWKELGKHMGLQQSDLKLIEHQYLLQTIECCWAVCNRWLDRNMMATWDDLLEKLFSISLERNSIASGLYQYLKSKLLPTMFVARLYIFTMSVFDMFMILNVVA